MLREQLKKLEKKEKFKKTTKKTISLESLSDQLKHEDFKRIKSYLKSRF